MPDINLSDLGMPVLMPVVRTYDWTSLVTFAGLGTVSVDYITCYRIGKMAFVKGRVTTGTTTATTALLTLPTGIIPSLPSTNSNPSIGSWVRDNVTINSNKSGLLMGYGADQSLRFTINQYSQGSTPFTAQQGNAILAASQVFSFEFSLPVTAWDEYEAIGTGVAKRDRAGLISAEDSGNVTLSFSGAQSGAVAAKYAMSGDVGSLWVSGNNSATTSANGSIAISLANIPVECRPKTNVSGFIRCLVAGASTVCLYDLDSGANAIYIYANATGGAWSANGTANSRFVSFFVSYPITDNP